MTPTRIMETTLSRHDHFFVVRQLFHLGHPINRWTEDHTVLEERHLVNVVEMLPDLSGPKSIVEVSVTSGVARDVSCDAARLVAGKIRSGDMPPTRDLINFVEDHHGVGTLLPAVA